LKPSPLIYQRRIIAFIDILGFKEIVKQSESNSTKMDLIYSVLDYLKNWESSEKWDLKFLEIEEDAQKKGVKNFDIRGRTNITSFSDSIVVSVLVDDNVNEMTSTLVVNLANIGAVLLEKGILFRGALTIGKILHIENGIVFGQGLIDAFFLETKSAKFPRIILSDKLIEQLNYPFESKSDRYPYHQYLERFDDGCVGLHQMIYYQVIQNWEEMTSETLAESLEKVRKVIINGLDSSFESPDVFEKYKWLKEQYNNLIIFGDLNNDSQTDEKIKFKIRTLNEGIAGRNVHFSYTDNFYRKNKK
jgi:hypothetical protein